MLHGTRLAERGYHLHHVVPQYIVRHMRALGFWVPDRLANWTVQVNPAYHQLITNAIREAYPFGASSVFTKTPAGLFRLLAEFARIYWNTPLPKGDTGI